ncbi:MAG: hypothetical protein SCK70_03485, partial [bacterium]|nr:hypothetical protein [bacterium]
MTSQTDMKTTISEKIRAFANGNIYSNVLNLLNVLGYRSDKIEKLIPNSTENFINTYDVRNIFNQEKALIDSWQSVDFIFQLTEDELGSQNNLFKTDKFNINEYQSYLFFAIELKPGNYSRGKYVSITREINKLFPMPVLIIFKAGDHLTFSIINRRPHKREQSKDVLEKVTLIKDINIQKPHRAHVEILFDLSYLQLRSVHSISNFLDLHDAWQKTLDSSELNKKFFKEIANWYFWAIKQAEFPADAEPNKDVRNAISIIRLITRLIFVWFLKEKNIVPEKLFDQSEMDNILNKTDNTGSAYYKAILQNLFFATLNTEMNKDKPGSRKFVERSDFKKHSQQHLMPAYRYERFFKNPVEAQQLFENIPFLNGGLFENLDY